MNQTDADVVGDVRRGNRDAFGLLVQRYQSRLFGLVLMIVRERGGAEFESWRAHHFRHVSQIRSFNPTPTAPFTRPSWPRKPVTDATFVTGGLLAALLTGA